VSTPDAALADAARAYALSRTWPAHQKRTTLDNLRRAKTREEIVARYAHVGELAADIDRTFTLTEALDLIGRNIETALNHPNHNLLVTTPPQEGKSTLTAVWTPIRALQLNPNRRIILGTYGDDLAEDHSRACRDLICRFGSGVVDPLTGAQVTDRLGLRLGGGVKANRVANWKIEGGDGGMIAVGIGSATAGRPADLFIIDDPYKSMVEADSVTHRRKVWEWFTTVVLTRLSPQASIVLIQTRWHPDDLAGQILAQDRELPERFRSWRHINIPAISEVGIPDALEREPGQPMESARDGVDADGQVLRRDFPAKRRAVGERTWYALYQGSPRVPKGGLFLREWFTPHADPPPRPVLAVVGVDPADSGRGDETGIVVAMLEPDGTVVFTGDHSARMTADAWSRLAVEVALEVNACEISVEAYASGETYARVVAGAWNELVMEALDVRSDGGELSAVQQRALAAERPFAIHKWRAPGRATDAVARSAVLRQAFETRKARTVEHVLAVFEGQAADWMVGQHQPDRVAAAVIAHDRVLAKAGSRMALAAPLPGVRVPEPPAWMRQRLLPARAPW
jgi:hypothetical protein